MNVGWSQDTSMCLDGPDPSLPVRSPPQPVSLVIMYLFINHVDLLKLHLRNRSPRGMFGCVCIDGTLVPNITTCIDRKATLRFSWISKPRTRSLFFSLFPSSARSRLSADTSVPVIHGSDNFWLFWHGGPRLFCVRGCEGQSVTGAGRIYHCMLGIDLHPCAPPSSSSEHVASVCLIPPSAIGSIGASNPPSW